MPRRVAPVDFHQTSVAWVACQPVCEAQESSFRIRCQIQTSGLLSCYEQGSPARLAGSRSDKKPHHAFSNMDHLSNCYCLLRMRLPVPSAPDHKWTAHPCKNQTRVTPIDFRMSGWHRLLANLCAKHKRPVSSEMPNPDQLTPVVTRPCLQANTATR